MIKLYTAFTKEIDEPEVAVREIIAQLNPKDNAQKNTIGIVQFYYEFVETGVYQAIVDALPFEIVGCVSTFIGTSEQYGDFGLSVSMITGDDMDFLVRTVEHVDEKSREQLFEEVFKLSKEFSAADKPKMVMSFMAPMQHFSGDDLVASVNRQPEPFPLFGTIVFNDENKQEANLIVHGSNISNAMYAFVAFYGNVNPTFHVTTSFAYEKDFGDIAEITEADGPILKAVNGISAVDYLKKQGLINSENLESNTSVWAVPAILTNKDGTEVARAFLGIVEGTNYVYSAGTLETGAKISFFAMDGEKTLSSAEKLLAEISESDEGNVIAFSCAARSWSLGSQHLSEVKKVAECADKYRQRNNKTLNYCLSYSAGELCPIVRENGELINALHNYTLTACSLG